MWELGRITEIWDPFEKMECERLGTLKNQRKYQGIFELYKNWSP